MSTPSDRRYLETHEWHQLQGDTVTVGITKFAADELTDITFVDLPSVGDKVVANKPFGEIESVKATADLMCGVSGTVTAINEGLSDSPGLVNKDPYAGGWMIKVKVDSPAEVDRLLDVKTYLQKTGH